MVSGHTPATNVGEAIKGNKIDLFMDTREECIEFGRQVVRVRIVELDKDT